MPRICRQLFRGDTRKSTDQHHLVRGKRAPKNHPNISTEDGDEKTEEKVPLVGPKYKLLQSIEIFVNEAFDEREFSYLGFEKAG